MRKTLDFMLYDWLQIQNLSRSPYFASHSKETFDAVLDTCETIAAEKFAPFNRLTDTEEPHFDGEKVVLPKATHDAMQTYIDSGMLAAANREADGGAQLPFTLYKAAGGFFAKASVSMGYGMLTTGNANAIITAGSEKQISTFAHTLLSGRWLGTMCLSEPQAGSSLSDITTRAEPDGEGFAADALGARYRLRGNKMWISGGEHELAENIVHLVLAKIPDENGKLVAGTRGISLFIVPKKLVNENAELTGERNDIALAGLNHKLGWRGTSNCLLNFGEGKFTPHGKAGAIGYLVGKPGEGLKGMFHMMNEARIAIGMSAVMLGMAGYEASLAYAQTRSQGRALGAAGKDAASPQTLLINHSDVKRMLLQQKAYCEGALALVLYCATLVDEKTIAKENGDAAGYEAAHSLLELLTPIVKSWPSEFCLEANSLAIQIHGGYGYTRDFPVEQYWRDNRLNMIHEGAHGIQAQDLLGRKVIMQDGKALGLLLEKISASCAASPNAAWGEQLSALANRLPSVTQAIWASPDPNLALANATLYMQAVGHICIAWMWLELARIAAKGAHGAADAGRLKAAAYFFIFELSKVAAQLDTLSQNPKLNFEVQAEEF